jgi:hypothetical protein
MGVNVSKRDEYRKKLQTLESWDSFLLEQSGLPGPRGNIELAQSVADEGNAELFYRYTAYSADKAPVNSPYEFLAFCGVIGLGRLLADGDINVLEALRAHASDPRWRTREAVAMALQRFGKVDMDGLISSMQDWSKGTPLEQRAVAAGLCEPSLLENAKHAEAVLRILDRITASIESVDNRRSEEFIALRKGLAYCWSVAVVALPEEGKALMEKWLATSDKDIRWIMHENLKKNRLVRMDPVWVEQHLLKQSKT